MRKYWELLISQIKVDTAYIAWYWADMFSSILRLFIMYFFWAAVFQHKHDLSDISFESMITYVVLAMIMESYITGAGTMLAHNIKNGDIALELLKPYDYLTKLQFMDLGSKVSGFVRASIPVFLLGFFFADVQLPATPGGFLLFIISFMIGICIGAQVDLIIGVFAFWTVNIWGLRVLREAVAKFFSGALVPLTLFPDWFQAISQYLPFQSMIYVPVAIYTGQIPAGKEAYLSVLTQCVWLIITFISVRIIWSQAIKKVTIFGG
ncbi:ABC transporter permease [Falsibacillus albus]|uniref:ABC transporter permease n=1 Tax=Falsibacillus albus TaxID=2478915 RepID=A0A3L7JRS8_9BACI|nr:ABC-2 family transporter protein [Falsibacillus albus]RLQ93376.1 hypothetical protein D9X91_18110 [Falsibacillus albus]